MHKYTLVRSVLERDPLLLSRGVLFSRAPLASDTDLLRVHAPHYLHAVATGSLTPQRIRELGFPWSAALVTRSRASAGGTLAATRALLARPTRRICAHLAGGTHHAFSDRGSGFCVFNDLAVAARAALDGEVGEENEETRSETIERKQGRSTAIARRVNRVLIVDLDTHQGDGTAHVFRDEARVVTFSMHGENNFPGEKMRSDYDVALPDGTGDAKYLSLLLEYLPDLLRKYTPGLVLYQAGVDTLAQDSLGKLAMTRAGLSQRNRIVYKACLETETPCVVTMGGGYARPDIGPSVDAHADVYRDAVIALDSYPN